MPIAVDFWNFKFVTVGMVKRVELHQCAKFRQNWLNRGRDMAFFRFFNMAAVAILDFEISNILRSGCSRGFNCIIMPNFVEIAQTAAEIWLFLDFSRWRPPDFWNFNFFNGWNGQEGRAASACQILSKSLEPRLSYNNFLIFPRWRPSAILDL